MRYIIGLLLPIISYFLQIYPRFFNKHFGVDVWSRLIEIDLVRKNNHKIPLDKIYHGFILSGYYDYPPIFLQLLSFLDKKKLKNIQGFIAPIFDALQNLLVFFIAMRLTNDLRIAIVAQLVYTLTPISALENSALTPRSLGYLLFTLSFYPLLYYINIPNANSAYLAIGIIFTVLVLLSHKFAAQSLLFVSIFFALLEKTPIYLVSFAAAVIISIFISRGYYLRVFKSHLATIYFWVKNYPNRFAHQIYGNMPPSKNPDLIGIIYKLLSKLAPITLLASNIWILSAFAFLFLKIPALEIINKFVIWVIFFYAFGATVLSVKKLTPIGEGYRYLEMTPVPTAILSSFVFFHFYNSSLQSMALIVFIAALAGNLCVILFFQRKAVILDKNRSLTNDMKKIFSFINKLAGKPRIICIPHQNTTMTLYHTKADVLVNFDGVSLLKMQNLYPVLKKPVDYFAKKYNLNYLLLRESFAKLKDLKIKNPKVVFRAGDNLLIKLSD